MPLFCVDELGRLPAGIEKTGSGGGVFPARIGRCGVYNYVIDGKPVRVLRTEDEVFHPDSLASLARCPVTIYHPSPAGERVTPDNYRQLNVGFLEAPRRDGIYVGANLVVQDGQTLDLISKPDTDPTKLSDVSAGYDMEFLKDAGGNYVSGVDKRWGPYDRVHTKIRYNHVSLGHKGWGRAGQDVRLQVDGNTADYIRGMDVLTVDEAAPVVVAAVVAPVVPAPVAAPVVTDAKDLALAKETARADVLAARVAELEAAAVAKPIVTDSAVAARAALVTDAALLAPDFKVTDSMTSDQVRQGALEASGFKPTRTDSAYLEFAFEAKRDLRKLVVDSHSAAVATIQSQGSTVVTDSDDPLLAAQAASFKRSLGLK